jgi:Xaa-Pro aminopeptidase
MIDGYHVGVCRTAVVGEAPPHAERVWANLNACKQLLLNVMAPGASTRGIYDMYLKKLRELDLPPISFIGHGMGLQLHEDPYLGPTADQPLEAGMVLAFEPLVFETGFNFGMQIKDVVVIMETGCELLSNFTNTDQLIVVR